MTWIIPQGMLTQPPRGCICPPGANKECENQTCPRKPMPSVAKAAEQATTNHNKET